MNDQSGETREETIINALREVTSETLVATLSLQPTTVPVKCKLTVTRNSNDSTRSSILETRILRVSSLESSPSSFESSRSSFESS